MPNASVDLEVGFHHAGTRPTLTATRHGQLVLHLHHYGGTCRRRRGGGPGHRGPSRARRTLRGTPAAAPPRWSRPLRRPTTSHPIPRQAGRGRAGAWSAGRGQRGRGGDLMSAGWRRSEVGHTCDAGWQIGVSKTVDRSVEAVWTFITSPAGVAIWLGEGVTVLPARGAGYETTAGVRGRDSQLPRARPCPAHMAAARLGTRHDAAAGSDVRGRGASEAGGPSGTAGRRRRT